MIARKSFIIVISNFILQVLGWVGIVVLAKTWGAASTAALGSIAFAMSFIAIFNTFADLGFGKAHIKRVSEGKDLGTCIGTYATIKVFLTMAMVVAVLTSLFIMKTFLNQNFSDATTESLIYVFLLYYIFTNLSAIPRQTFVAKKKMVKLNLPDIFGRMVKVPLSILVALTGVHAILVQDTIINVETMAYWPEFLRPLQIYIYEHALGAYAFTYTLDMLIVLAVGFYFLRKYPIKRPSYQMFKNYAIFALPITLMSVIGIISTNIDKLMIGFFWTNVEVGYYFTVQRVFEMISIIYMSLGTVLFPTFSELHSTNNIDKIKETVDVSARYLSMVVMPVIVVIIIFVNPVIYILLDKSFLPAAPVLLVLTIYAFLEAILRPYAAVITGIDKVKIGAKSSFFVCTTNIILNYLFIPQNGLLSYFGINGPTGAAFATVLSCTFGFIYIRIMLKRLIGLKYYQKNIPKHIFAGVIMGLILYYLSNNIFIMDLLNWYHLLIYAFGGLAIYIGILFLLKEFNKKDLMFFLDIIHPKKLLSYVNSELKEKK